MPERHRSPGVAVPASPDSPRHVDVRLRLEGGQEVEVRLREDAPELTTLFQILASRGGATEPVERLMQLPLEQGRSACSFHSSQLVSIVTEPPVLVQLALPEPPRPSTTPEAATRADARPARPAMVRTPRYHVIDDFLSPDEHRDMLAYALQHESEFESGTVEGKASPHRQNQVIMGFADTAHSRLLQNRLLTWLPYLNRALEIDPFPLGGVESQLTASNDGHYYRLHCDAGGSHASERVLTCVYYFFRQPRPFSGGGLRLYDVLEQENRRMPMNSFRELQPVSNRLLVFHSTVYHELVRIRCPSRQFADSRFAVTNWLIGTDSPNEDARFGWGQLRCGAVSPDAEN